jgi:pimeloyl-ACP methyl ester carboxylesterase
MSAQRPVAVAIPGTLCSPTVFDRLGARLADHVVLDPVSWMTEPGPWDLGTVADRIARRYTGPVVVIGHSTGGAIAMRLAVDHPDLVSALLIVDSGAHMKGHGDVDRILATMEHSWGPELHAAVLDRSFASPLDPADRADLLAYAAEVPVRAALEALRSQRDLDLTPGLADLTCPATVVHGTLDPTRTPAQARELADAIPGARLRLLDTGHTPVYEDPDSVAEELLALLARVDQSTPASARSATPRFQ